MKSMSLYDLIICLSFVRKKMRLFALRDDNFFVVQDRRGHI